MLDSDMISHQLLFRCFNLVGLFRDGRFRIFDSKNYFSIILCNRRSYHDTDLVSQCGR
jgi:hypothetical protein